MYRWLPRVAAALTLLGLVIRPSRLHADELRTWTDSTGKYKIEAEFVEILDGKVRLKDKDGKTVSLPLAKVSDADRAYLRELLKKRREAAAADPAPVGAAAADGKMPAAGVVGPPARNAARPSRWKVGDRIQYGRDADGEPGTVVAVNDDEVTVRMDGAPQDETISYPPNWIEPLSDAVRLRASWVWNPPAMKSHLPADVSALQHLAVTSSAPAQLAPDPAPVVAPPAIGPIRFGGKFGFFEGFVMSDVATGGAPTAIAAYSGGKDIHDESSRLEVRDAATGALRRNIAGPAKLKSIDLSPSGRRMITSCEKPKFFDPDGIDVWDVTDAGLVYLVGWQPYAGAAENHRSLASLRWLDDGRLLTYGGEETLIVWQIEGAKALYDFKVGNGAFAVSPGGKYLACASASGIEVFTLDSGKHVAHFNAAAGARAVSFSPAGTQLAVTGRKGIEIIDVTGRTPARQFALGNVGDLQWLDENFLLAGYALVIDAAKMVVVWQYDGGNRGWLENGRLWYKWGSGVEETIVNVILPHEAAKNAAGLINVQDVFVLKPGMAISLNVDLGDAAENDKATAALTKSAADVGLSVAAGQPITLTIRTRSGEVEERHYRAFAGSTAPDETISLPSRYYDLDLQAGGESLWSGTNRQSLPMSMQVPKGESIQQAVAREMAVNARFVLTDLPRNLVKSEYRKPRGKSELSEAGIR